MTDSNPTEKTEKAKRGLQASKVPKTAPIETDQAEHVMADASGEG